MSYQAGARSFTVATGADATFAVRFHREGGTVAAADLVPGDFVIYQERISPVFAVAPVGVGKTRVRLGTGSAFDPDLTLDDEALVPVAEAIVWEAADMQVVMPDSCYWPAPTTMAVPTEIDTDPTVLHINVTSAWLEPVQAFIDYAEGGPSGLSLPYDLVGTFDGVRTRVLTGSLNVVRSAASPVVDPLVPPGPATTPAVAALVGTFTP